MPKPCSRYRMFNQDCLKAISKIASKSIDTIITDPPYGLNFMSKEWDHGVPGRGFWARFRRVCKPGALLLAFGGTRTFHRLACAIEDGGWEIRDCMMWLHAQGFPKSLDISKAIDKAAGAEREVVGQRVRLGDKQAYAHNPESQIYSKDNADDDGWRPPDTAPATPAAKQWEGFGTALKPAWEPIILAMKPLDGTYAQNALKHGVAGINVDAGRVAGKVPQTTQGVNRSGSSYKIAKTKQQSQPSSGRWPANLILSHKSDEVCPDCEGSGWLHMAGAACPRCKGTKTIRGCVQVGVKRVEGTSIHGEQTVANATPSWKQSSKDRRVSGHADADGLETVEEWKCVESCPVKMLDEQSGECPSSGHYTKSLNKPETGREFLGRKLGKRKRSLKGVYAGDSGGASRFFYVAKASKRERNEGLPEGMVSNHPTVKPLGIMEYLCRLTAPPGGGVVFDPFMGSGTTGVACARTGRRFIGCEIDEKHGYFEIARRRIIEAYKGV